MLQPWKVILTNWINCYSNKSGDKEQCLNIESLHTIISHLRDNLNLDESKSGLLEAHTVEDFICEKYPEFKFENGTVEASNDEEVYLSASLLLFFVCVNSKNLVIKNAMCSKLSADDQEIILKFSKCLMGCPLITVSEVQAAITEACGQDIAAMELPRQQMVAETPPALRSMHCNIRRLQAELEAERFDRNYLQEELSRTNNRLDRLLKEKEQHKLEILNLKAKISLCCGDEGAAKNTEINSEVCNKLTRQLQQLELKLEETQDQLQDVTYERDTYKTKIDELKNERDKWLALTQQENARVSQLSEELDTERRHNQSLKDIVAELRQHNKLNGLDTSSLECDDPDASIHSLPHNSSICSEVCANVVEVQLGEERAKLAVLQQQMQTLQGQMNELNQIKENEKYALENVISLKENEICNLKHRINEEIEKKNHLKVHCDNEITKLNNELNELEQKIKDSHENSRTLIEEKMMEIQTLQEEKLSLLQSLNDETMKLQTTINDLQRELDSERQTRSRMKETYENQLMKLNEKVLNRSNEVVELQNSVFMKAEEIETLQIEIRNEKEALQKLKSEFDNMKQQNNIIHAELIKEQEASKKIMAENQNVHAQNNSLHFEIEKQRESFEGLMNKFQIANEEKDAVEKELTREQNVHKDLINKYKELEKNLKTVKEAGKKIQNKYHSMHEHHKTLKAEHAKDKEMYNDLKNKYQKLEDHNNTMRQDLSAANNALEEMKGRYDNMCEQYNTIESILVKERERAHQLDKNRRILEEENITYQNEIQKEKDAFKELMQNYQKLIEHKNEIENDLKVKCEEEQNIKLDLETKVMSLKDQLTNSENLAEKLKTSYECQIENLNVMVTKLSNHLKERTAEIETLKSDKDMLQKNVEVSSEVMKKLQDDLKVENQNIAKITSDFDSERQVLKSMVTVTESVMEDNKLALTNEITELLEAKYALELDYNKLEVSLKDLEMKYQTAEIANASLLRLIKLQKEGKIEVEKESETARDYLDQMIKELNFERYEKATLIHSIESQKQALNEEIENLKKVLDEIQNINDMLKNETEHLKKDLEEQCINNQKMEDASNHLKKELQSTEENLQKLYKEKSEIEESYQDALNNLQLAQGNVNELQKKIDYVTDENNNMKEKEYKSLLKIEEMNAAINILETELLIQKDKVDILMEKKTQAEQEVQKLTENLSHTLEKKSQAEINLHEKIENVAATVQEIKELKSQIAELSAENRDFKVEKHESDAELKELLKELQVDYNQLQKQQDVLPQQISELMNEYLMAAKGETTLSQKKTYAYIKSVLKEKMDQLVAVQLEKKELESKVTVLSTENHNLKLGNNETLSKLCECKAKENELTKELDVLQCLNKNLTVAMEAIEMELHAKVEKCAKIEENNQNLERALEEKLKALDTAQKEMKELEKNISEFTDLVNNLNKEKELSLAQIEELKTKVIDLEAVQKENQELKSTINALASELKNEKAKLKALLKEKSETEIDLNRRAKLVAQLSEDKLQVEKALEEKLAQEKSHSAMITKLTNYLKDKTAELEILRKDKDMLQQTVGDNCKVIKTLEENLKAEKQNIHKLTTDFESERQVLMNMVAATESIMEDTKLSSKNEISQHVLAKNGLEVEKKGLQNLLKDLEIQNKSLNMANASLISLLNLVRKGKHDVEKESEIVRDYLDEVISYLSKERNTNISVISALEFQEKTLAGDYEKMKNDLEVMQNINHDLKKSVKAMEDDMKIKEEKLRELLKEKAHIENNLLARDNQLSHVLESKTLLEKVIDEKTQNINLFQLEIRELKTKMTELFKERNNLEVVQKDSITKLEEYKAVLHKNETKYNEEIAKLNSEKEQLLTTIEENRSVITNLEQLIKHELEENHQIRDDFEQEKIIMANRCTLLQDYQTKAEKVLKERQEDIDTLKKEVQTLQTEVELCKQDCKAKDGLISKMSKEKDAFIGTISKELVEEKALREKLEKELEIQKSNEKELRNNMEIRALKKENEQLIRAIGQQETFTALSQEKAADKYICYQEHRDSYQVDNSSSDNTHSSVESLKTISDLEKIIHDKNRTITTLQTDIVYLKTLIAESETKLLDVAKELEISKDNTQQLSNQLKKIVNQKNEEIADLKKQVSKMSATENRATQIIKVSAKYQAMILKRIAEIKSNTVLKELTNFGNSENELRRSLNAGSVTMEDLENFLETTDRHLKRCAEKQIALQKERDRLTEVNRIHESEIINLKKFLTELSVSFQTFSSVKDLYAHKLSRVISVQRTVRREILSLDGRVSDATMCKLERGYGATMQDLSECTMNLERWVERCISRTVSVEKIKQAFTSDTERTSLSSPSFQNTGLEIQLEELEKSFQKLLEEIARAVKNEGVSESQASTVMEVRAEYEDKLNRMKAKMKDLFNEQMALLKKKQRDEIEILERELEKARSRMEDSKRAYESHIKELTKELWSVGEKYLVKNDEAEWLRKKQRSGSLMSLQHVHSSGLVPAQEVQSRPSDAHSLRSLQISESYQKKKREGRGLHMSDEEGEVFDNRCLKELAMTPRREPPGQRLSELKWRNSLCPPHLKSSYPAETQFAPTLDEEDLKASGSAIGARGQRKEVGITAYKKPGPPTPSKQAGRLSATDSELRESLRVENDPHAHTERKTSTPARFRAFLRLNKHESSDGTPRRRLSNIFRKK